MTCAWRQGKATRQRGGRRHKKYRGETSRLLERALPKKDNNEGGKRERSSQKEKGGRQQKERTVKYHGASSPRGEGRKGDFWPEVL